MLRIGAAPGRALGLMALLLPLLSSGCAGRPGDDVDAVHRDIENRPYLLETIGEFAVVRLYADGFENLSPRERILSFYLTRAALAGRDIQYDQMGRYNLRIRDLCEEILTHPRGIAREILDSLHEYLKLIWINGGIHNDRTKRKFVPAFAYEQLESAARQAVRNGARLRLALGETVQGRVESLRRAIFDPDFEPLVTCKSPPPGEDLLTCSSVNYYEGVRLEEVERFDERYPLNSRLVRDGDGLIEEVYRFGRGDVPPGRYASELKTVVGFLEKARVHAEEPQNSTLGLLAAFFATGDPEAFRRFNIAWVKSDSRVDTINGFIETYKDPRSRKGAFEGMVYFVDESTTSLQRDLAARAQQFEDRAPWDARFKRRGIRPPTANTVNLLAAVGDAGPMPPVGVNLPNEEAIREQHGSKSISLVNIMDSARRALLGKRVEEFAHPDDRPLIAKHGARIGLLQTMMHEVLGHASGKSADDLEGAPRDHLREYFSTLEEARAELVALHNFFDPALIEIGAIESTEVAEAAYRDFVVNDLYLLRRVRDDDRIEDDHMRATHLIVGYLRAESGAVETTRLDGKTYYRVTDVEAMRTGVASLLAEIQRIKGEGDFAAAGGLVERFGIRIDPAIRDEVVGRAESAAIPSYVVFVMPDLRPVRDADGVVTDVRVEYRSDFTEQMLQYSGKRPLE
ncbi:MAG: peptidase M49 [Acidobacteriota bacterium]